MPAKTLPVSRLHPAAEVLEEYCLGHATGPVLSRVEDHLLACPECCAKVADLDVYLDLMKAGLAGIEELQSAKESGPTGMRRRLGLLKLPRLSIGTALRVPLPAIPRAHILGIAALAVFVLSATLAWQARRTPNS